MDGRQGFVAALSVIAFAFVLMILPVAFFLMSQPATPYDTRSKASEGEDGQVATAPGFVIDDVYVDSDLPNKSMAESQTLWADGQSVKISYLKFNLMPLIGRPFKIAKLRLFVNHTAGPVQNVYAVSDVSWQGHGVTFASRPVLGAIVAKISGGSQGQWVEVDVTSYVKNFVGKQMSLAIGSDNINGLGFSSLEASSGRPELVVE